jgi:hypothetical protein
MLSAIIVTSSPLLVTLAHSVVCPDALAAIASPQINIVRNDTSHSPPSFPSSLDGKTRRTISLSRCNRTELKTVKHDYPPSTELASRFSQQRRRLPNTKPRPANLRNGGRGCARFHRRYRFAERHCLRTLPHPHQLPVLSLPKFLVSETPS